MRCRQVAMVVASAVIASGLTGLAPLPAQASGAPASAADPEPLPLLPAAKPVPPALSDTTDPAWLTPPSPTSASGSAAVDVPVSGHVRVGKLPVYVGRPASGAAPARVQVTVLGDGQRAATGARFVAFEVTRADRGPGRGAVSVEIDYAAFARAFGAGFTSRLRLVRLPACAKSRPQDPACSGWSPVPTRNDVAGQRLRAEIPTQPDPTAATADSPSVTYDTDSGFGPQTDPEAVSVTSFGTSEASTFAVASAAEGADGDFSATPVQPAGSWQVGVSSGGFSYSYPIQLPPPVAGPAPNVSLGYSSQSVDGRTASVNGQVSQTGQGWSLDTGYIERRFASCADDGHPSWGDLCWHGGIEYFLNFNGRSDRIVRHQNTNEWRLRDDPAWRILSFTGAPNGDDNGEYFLVIEPSGTKHWFGSGTEPRNTPPRYTNSAYTVPVFGDDAGEPCALVAHCQQAWRWNVDRTQDTNDNVVSYFYGRETNYYARHGVATDVSQYVRGGYPVRIEYSQRNGAEGGQNAPSIVKFDVQNRCTGQASPTVSECPDPVPQYGTSYPDVPMDLMCTSATSCPAPEHRSPTFFSTKLVRSVTTYVDRGGALPVATYAMTYSFPPTDDDTTPSLWLRTITKTGHYGTPDVALPPVRFTGTLLANRVNTGAGVPPANKYRIGTVQSELGATTTLTYGQPYPCNGVALAEWDVNETHCFPAWSTVGDDAGWVAYRKYAVTARVTDDTTGISPAQRTEYEYLDAPAWHHENSTLPHDQSWSEYRGHARVRVVNDPGGSTGATETRYLTFRGMHGDKLLGGGTRDISLVDSNQVSRTDDHYLQGYPLEEQHFALGGVHYESRLHRYWRDASVTGPAGYPRHDAVYVRESTTIDKVRDTSTTNGAWRSHQVDTWYEPTYAMPTQVYDHADPGSGTDDTCAVTTYTPNVATSTTLAGGNTWLVQYPDGTSTYGVTCGGTQVAQTDIAYDGQSSNVKPLRGNPTETWAYGDGTGGNTSRTKIRYDALGRVVAVVSPNEVRNPGGLGGSERATTTSYAPATGYPIDGVTTTNPLGHKVKAWTAPPWATPERIEHANYDPNDSNTATRVTLDALGRRTSVTRPGDAAGVPSLKFAYAVSQTEPTNVSTRRLLDGTRYVVNGIYLDGFGRTIQTETHEPNGGTGRLIAQTRYDAQGRVAAQTEVVYDLNHPLGAGVAGTMPTARVEVQHLYDSRGLKAETAQYAAGELQWRTTVQHFGLFDRTNHPVHTDVDEYHDVFGRASAVVERPVGQPAATTRYTYTHAGDLDRITDPDGNLTNYDYDWLHRKVRSSDPDAGVWTFGYDANGNTRTTRDALGATVADSYDVLDRLTHRRAESDQGSLLASWTFDTVLRGKGLPATAARHVGSAVYTSAVTAYDGRGRATGKTITIPGAEGNLAGTYAYAYGYDSSDNPTSVRMPAAGGLAAETVTTAYNAAGRPTTLTGDAAYGSPSYVASTHYDGHGAVDGRVLSPGDVSVTRSYSYDTAARRLSRVLTQTQLDGAPAVTVEDNTYRYDAESNVTSVGDAVDGQTECFR